MAEKTAIDELGDLEFFRKMLKFFGARRAAEVFGYAFAAAASGQQLPSEIVAALVSVGFSKSGVYRALADIKRFAMQMEEERGHTMLMSEVLSEISSYVAYNNR